MQPNLLQRIAKSLGLPSGQTDSPINTQISTPSPVQSPVATTPTVKPVNSPKTPSSLFAPTLHTPHSFISDSSTPSPYYDTNTGALTNAGRLAGKPDVNAPKFKLDTSNINSNHLSGDNTPYSVMTSMQNPYLDALGVYNQNAPSALTAGQAYQFSPSYLNAYNQSLNTNQGLRLGIQNIRGRAEPLDFQQGQEAMLTRDTALQQQANAENMALQEAIRQNNIQAVQGQQTQAQNQFQNTFNATQGGLNYQLGLGGLAIQQQQANQSRYEYQQIIDSNTGFPTIQILDKQTGLPVGNVSPSSSIGQNIVNSGIPIGGTSNYGTQVVNQTLGIIGQGIQPNQSLAQVVNQYGIQSVVGALIQQEGGSPQGVLNNPGNIKFNSQHPFPGSVNSGVQAKDGGTFASFPTMQAGINAVADIVHNAMNGQSNAYGINPTVGDFIAKYKGVNNQTNQSNSKGNYQQILQNAPMQLQSAIKPLPDGNAYIDSSLLAKPEFGVMAQNYASQNGIRLLNSSDASAINTITQSIKNMQTLSNTFADLASKGVIGQKLSNITDPLSKFFDTNYGSQLKSYQSNREGLFQQIRALAGSSPRLNSQELNTASNSMPTLEEFNKDTYKDGVNKLVKTQSYLDNAIRTFIPSYVGTPIQVGGQFAVLGNDGKAYTFQDNQSALAFLQAQNQ